MKRIYRDVLFAAACIALCIAVVPREGFSAERITSVMGVVQEVRGTVLTVANRAYDVNGIPVRSAQTGTLVDISALRGYTAEIIFRNKMIDSVTVYRTMPQ